MQEEPSKVKSSVKHFHLSITTFSNRSLDAVKEHVGKHEKQDRITDNYYVTVEEDDESCASDCQHKKSTHYHCAYVREIQFNNL